MLEHHADPNINGWRRLVVDFGRAGTEEIRLEWIVLFLRHGAEPKFKYSEGDIWKARLDQIFSSGYEYDSHHLVYELRLLLSSGASPDVWIGEKSLHDAILETFDRAQAAELLRLIKEK